METALVTGANGFIGSHLSVELVEQGVKVFALQRSMGSKNIKYNQFVQEGKIQVIRGDITNISQNTNGEFKVLFNNTETVLPKVNYIFHIAGKVSVWGKYEDFKKINLGGTTALLNYAKNIEAKCFSYLSSVAVYGFYGYKNLKEEDEKKPFKNPYSLSKLEAENYVKKFGQENGLNYVIIRPGNVYGEYDYTSSHEIYTRVKKQKMLISAGGKYESCFVYVGNLVEAILHTAFNSNCHNTDYNVSDSNNTLKQYLTNVAQTFGVRAKFTNFAKPLAKMTAGLVEGIYHMFFIKKAPLITRFSVYQNCEDYSFSIDKLKSVGYKPKYSNEEGIKKTVDWINTLETQNKEEK
ncbi:MAG: NAD(P)-dependent oxidoreductase [Clostridiales bacterium]|nr:NAD(P)-dependent oxidoreductase [Clostridiales bacterium]